MHSVTWKHLIRNLSRQARSSKIFDNIRFSELNFYFPKGKQVQVEHNDVRSSH